MPRRRHGPLWGGRPARPAERSGSRAGGPWRSIAEVIADHSRAATFLISDGVIFFERRRGYVLRQQSIAADHARSLLGTTTRSCTRWVFSVGI